MGINRRAHNPQCLGAASAESRAREDIRAPLDVKAELQHVPEAAVQYMLSTVVVVDDASGLWGHDTERALCDYVCGSTATGYSPLPLPSPPPQSSQQSQERSSAAPCRQKKF